MLQVILSCVYGLTTTARLKQQGMEFAVWVFKHADDAQLQPHSGTILQKLLHLLNEGSACPLVHLRIVRVVVVTIIVVVLVLCNYYQHQWQKPNLHLHGSAVVSIKRLQTWYA